MPPMPPEPLPDPLASFVAPARAHPALWRLVLGTGLSLGGWLAAGLLLVPGAGDRRSWLLLFLASFGGLVLGLALALRLLHGRRLASLIGPGGLRVRPLAMGAAACFAVTAFSGAAAAALAPPVPSLGLAAAARILPVALALIALQATAEELFFRGYLLQGLAARFRSPLVWWLLPGLAFGAMHWNPADYGAAAPVAVVSATLLGLLLADITARTGNLSAAIGIHVANNVTALLVLAPASALDGLALRVLPGPVGPLVALDLATIVAASGLWLILRRRIGRQSGASM